MMPDGMMGPGMSLWMVLNMIFSLLVIVGIVMLIAWAVEKLAGGDGRRQEESALEILKKRYAKGEISKEEYEEIKRDLL